MESALRVGSCSCLSVRRGGECRAPSSGGTPKPPASVSLSAWASKAAAHRTVWERADGGTRGQGANAEEKLAGLAWCVPLGLLVMHSEHAYTPHLVFKLPAAERRAQPLCAQCAVSPRALVTCAFLCCGSGLGRGLGGAPSSQGLGRGPRCGQLGW